MSCKHILREIDRAIDFSFIYDPVRDLYCLDNGRPSVDPVALFKIVLIRYTFGIRSMRQTIREIEVNMAYRWFLGYGMTEAVPHFTTFGKNYLRRFAGEGKETYKLRKETIERVFADAKVNHGLRYTQFRGLARPKMQVLLTFACMNLRKPASWKRKNGLLPPVLRRVWDLLYFFSPFAPTTPENFVHA